MKYDVAVITPVYNTQDYLHRCIRSVLRQKGVSCQHIIIDDGSDDNSAEIARYYQSKDRRVTFISKGNEGQGVARNIGLSIADAEYVQFVDSDDSLGPDSLASLYGAAKESHLDLCSAAVPSRYFDRPLDYIACLPNKSQFMRLDLIRRFDLRQPDVRSGQDGVFSHLFLAHANRIGMLQSATYNYTHAREGSTFVTYLKRSHLVPDIIEKHYDAIIQHYDEWDLWSSNAVRLLEFIDMETMTNRLKPHFGNLSENQQRRCVSLLMRVAKRAATFLTKEQMEHVSPAQFALIHEIDPAKWISAFAGGTLVEVPRKIQPSHLVKGHLMICKYEVERVERSEPMKFAPSATWDIGMAVPKPPPNHKTEFEKLERKIDLSINMLVNQLTHTRLAYTSSLPVLGMREGADLVVSMTSLPHRLNYLGYTIESIFRQAMVPKRIVVWLSDVLFDRSEVTHVLRPFIAQGLDVRFVKDVGPHTKLIYALEHFPDSVIVTVDDDMMYPANTLQCLWEQHLIFPRSVIANWAREIAFGADGEVLGIRSGKLLTPPMLERNLEQEKTFVGAPNMLAYPYGTCGVLYPPKALSKRVFEHDTYSKLCPKEDDLWFKAMGMIAGTDVVVTNLGINPRHHSIVGTQNLALRHENHGEGRNIEQIRKVFNDLDLYSHIAKYRGAGPKKVAA